MRKRELTELARQMRKEPTRSEAKLWAVLRNRGLGGVKFRRQKVVGPFVVDFYASSCKLVVEVDGAVHDGREEWDNSREDFLINSGRTVIRFRASDVENRLDWVLKKIEEVIADL